MNYITICAFLEEREASLRQIIKENKPGHRYSLFSETEGLPLLLDYTIVTKKMITFRVYRT